MQREKKRLLLSKNLLEMKFMRKTKEKTEKQIEDEERQAEYAHEITSAMKSQGEKFVAESSYAICEGLVFGRMSFKGVNPEIEKLMARLEQEIPSVNPILREDEEADIAAIEVAKINLLNKKIKRKFRNKKLFHQKKIGFKKPTDV